MTHIHATRGHCHPFKPTLSHLLAVLSFACSVASLSSSLNFCLPGWHRLLYANLAVCKLKGGELSTGKAGLGDSSCPPPPPKPQRWQDDMIPAELGQRFCRFRSYLSIPAKHVGWEARHKLSLNSWPVSVAPKQTCWTPSADTVYWQTNWPKRPDNSEHSLYSFTTSWLTNWHEQFGWTDRCSELTECFFCLFSWAFVWM